MSVTRAAVLIALRRLGYFVTCGDLAQIMDETSYAVSKALQGLYATDKIDRETTLCRAGFRYRAKAVVA